MLGAFRALAVQVRDGDTPLSADLPDQAALYGLLHQIETLGLELLELRRLPR